MANPDPTTTGDSRREEVRKEMKISQLESLKKKKKELQEELENIEKSIEELEEGVDIEDLNKRRTEENTVDGTPNREEEIQRILEQDPPSDEEFDKLSHEEATLHNLIIEGPSALTVKHNPVYPVHKRARNVLLHAPSIGQTEEINGTMNIRITLPEAKLHIESREETSIKHTQMRRVLDKLEEAGKDYPRPPIVHKNSAGHIELVLFDYDALYDTRE